MRQNQLRSAFGETKPSVQNSREPVGELVAYRNFKAVHLASSIVVTIEHQKKRRRHGHSTDDR